MGPIYPTDTLKRYGVWIVVSKDPKKELENNMKKIRLSHSLMYLWERGDVDGAVSTYCRLDRPITRQMKEGREIHQEIEEHIGKYNTFPEWFFDAELKLPQPEREVVVKYNEMFDIKGIFDCMDVSTNTLYEFKTGVSNSLEHARTYQIPLYFFIAELANIDVDKAYVIRWDQYNKKTDWCIVHNSEKLREKGKNLVDSVGPEIYAFFEQEGII